MAGQLGGAWLARRQRQVQPHRAAGQVGQRRLDAAGVLRPDPVELEAVGHAQAHHHAVGPVIGDTSAGGSGRIQVLNCCSGSSAPGVRNRAARGRRSLWTSSSV
jgi:hypothetical protein